MNVKKLFLSLFLTSSIVLIRAEENINIKAISESWEKIHQLVINKHKNGEYKNYSGIPLTNANQQTILLFVQYSKSKDKNTVFKAKEILKYICTNDPELMQETIDFIIDKKIYEYLEPLINAGANLNAEVGKCYTLKEKLEARFGSIKIDAIESSNCNGIWSKIFGQSEECKTIKRNLDLFEQKKAANS